MVNHYEFNKTLGKLIVSKNLHGALLTDRRPVKLRGPNCDSGEASPDEGPFRRPNEPSRGDDGCQHGERGRHRE